MRRRACALALLALLWVPGARAWGPRGHAYTVAVAEQLLAGTRAERELQARLAPAGWTLAQAAVWPDCLRAVQREGEALVYRPEGRHPECRPFEDAAGRALAERGVWALAEACGPRVAPDACHKRLHYTDVPIQRRAWVPGEAGARDHDIVAALSAAVEQLQGRTPRGPVRYGDAREALAWLAHLVADLHQPLHVGALYLDAQGRAQDPALAGRLALDTVGGNRLRVGRHNLHALWDEMPRGQLPAQPDASVLAEARAVPRPGGPPAEWPRAWAAETLGVAHQALSPLRFGPATGEPPQWAVLDEDGGSGRAAVQRRALVRAGARLAQLLQAIWP